LNTILGADTPRHIHGLGLVPHANQVFGVSSSSHFQDMHLTSLEDTRNEDLLSIRLQLEMMQKHMKSHDAKFLELTEKTVSTERHFNLKNFSIVQYHVLMFYCFL
jgi:hypothetical protein